MFILSNSYSFKDDLSSVFKPIFKENINISYSAAIGNQLFFASKNELYLLKNGKGKKIAGFTSEITCLTSHQDLLCVGTMEGEVQIFSGHRTSIRRFKNHSAEISDIVITDNQVLISSGRDLKINFQNIQQDKLIKTIELDKNYANAICYKDDHIYLFLTEIYKLNISDYRMETLYKHSNQIDRAIVLNNNRIIFTCGNVAYIFCLIESIILKSEAIHSRKIEKIAEFDGRIYSCSADRHFKTFNLMLKRINFFVFDSSLIGFTIVTENNRPVICATNGKIYTIVEEKSGVTAKKYIERRKAYEDEIQYNTIQPAKKRLTEIDSMLQRFEYKNALKTAFYSDMKIKYAILNHIYQKRVLMRALKDGDVDFVKNVMNLCIETINIDGFLHIVVEIMLIISSLYSNQLVDDPELKYLLNILSGSLNEQVEFKEMYLRMSSFLESFEKS